MAERQMPSLAAFEDVRTPNAFSCNVRGMSERQKPSLAAFEECDSAKCLHLKRLRNVKVPNAFT
eukprot:1324074-Amphidinium_carterae.1